MGLFDYLKRRRDRESATHGISASGDPSQQVEPMPASGQVQPEGASTQPAGLDLAQLAQIGPMIQRAIQSGNIQVSVGEPQTIDLQGSGLREEIMGIMSEHGIDADPLSAQQIDPSALPEMQQQILDALEQHGLDLGAIGGGDIQISPGDE